MAASLEVLRSLADHYFPVIIFPLHYRGLDVVVPVLPFLFTIHCRAYIPN